MAPEFKAVEASTLAIAGRSISTLIKTQGIGDLYQMYEFAQQNHVDYNVAYIPGDRFSVDGCPVYGDRS